MHLDRGGRTRGGEGEVEEGMRGADNCSSMGRKGGEEEREKQNGRMWRGSKGQEGGGEGKGKRQEEEERRRGGRGERLARRERKERDRVSPKSVRKGKPV